VDIDHPGATAALIDALAHLSGGNRELAVDGLLRTSDRKKALQSAVEQGKLNRDAVILARLDRSSEK
jgi:hypothetical protein